MALAGLSTLDIRLLYGVETTAGTKPSSFNYLTRVNAVGGITQDTEQIDASALEDTSSKYIAGRADTGGTVSVTINLTQDTVEEWEDLISAYNTAHASNRQMWFELTNPGLGTQAFFFIAEPPQEIPMPESGQNELWTVEIPLAIVDYIGLDTKVVPSGSGD